MEHVLHSFVEDVKYLTNIVEKPFERHDTRMKRAWARFKSVRNQEKIVEILSRLDNHKRNLTLALLTNLRYVSVNPISSPESCAVIVMSWFL